MGHSIAAKAVAFYEALTPEFSVYANQIVNNTRELGKSLKEKGLRLVSDGTDTHMILVDARGLSITGAEAEKCLKDVGIIVNKNTIPFDQKSPMVTSGFRIGTAALTSRGFIEKDMKFISDLICRALNSRSDEQIKNKILINVKEFAESFPLPGIDK